jgi:catalase-peroxidase
LLPFRLPARPILSFPSLRERCSYFDNLFGYDWELTKTPAGAQLWVPKDKAAHTMVPDAHVADKKHPPVMFTSDMALKLDPAYGPISKRFHENPDQFADAFKRAWYKLTHRDMGPATRLLGSKVPEPQLWQDAVPAGVTLSAEQIMEIKTALIATGIAPGKMVRTAWASAVTYRRTDYRGGANGARLRLSPQKDWACNDPAELQGILAKYAEVQAAAAGGAASIADIIVLGGCAGIEAAARAAGIEDCTVPFVSGRGDATDETTDAASFAVLEPVADGFRNFFGDATKVQTNANAESMFVDKAQMLTLTKAEMVLLVGGLRVLGANAGDCALGVFTDTPGKLTNDFFVNLLDMKYEWKPSASVDGVYEGKDRATGEVKWTGSRVDLVIGSNSELRAVAEFYACDDGQAMFVKDFAAAFARVMNLDRFDVFSS